MSAYRIMFKQEKSRYTMTEAGAAAEAMVTEIAAAVVTAGAAATEVMMTEGAATEDMTGDAAEMITAM